MKITQTIATNKWTFSPATPGLTYNITSNANTYQRNDGIFNYVSPEATILPSKLSFVKRYKHTDEGWCATQVEPWPNEPEDTRSEDPEEGEEAYYGSQFLGDTQWYKVSCIWHNIEKIVTCVEYRTVDTNGYSASIMEDNKTINFYQSVNNYTFTPYVASSLWDEDLNGGFTAATEAGSVMAYAKFTPFATNIKVDNTDLASLCEPKEMSESLNFTAVDNGGNYHFSTNRDLSIFAKNIPGVSAITSGKLKNSGVDVNIAGLGERPIAEELCRIITPGTYSIVRTDSLLTIGSNTYTASHFRNKVIPKVIGVLLVGGGGGGGGGSSTHSQGSGSGGGGGSLSLVLMDLRTVSNYTLNIGARGISGLADNDGNDGNLSRLSYTYNGSSYSLLCYGGKKGLCCKSTSTYTSGGQGGIVDGSFMGPMLHMIKYISGGNGGHSCVGNDDAVKGGDISITGNLGLGEEFCAFTHSQNAEWRTESDISGCGGGAGCSYGVGQKGIKNGDGGHMDQNANPGILGAGGPGGKRKPSLGNAGPGHHGGDGLAIFYY